MERISIEVPMSNPEEIKKRREKEEKQQVTKDVPNVFIAKRAMIQLKKRE